MFAFRFQSGLQRRLTDQEETVIRMKAELLRMGFAQQSAETEKVIIVFWNKFSTTGINNGVKFTVYCEFDPMINSSGAEIVWVKIKIYFRFA